MKKINEKIPPQKKRKLTIKEKNKEDEINRNIKMSNKSCNDWIFKIHWNKAEWINPRNLI